jgi:hypothetical protein
VVLVAAVYWIHRFHFGRETAVLGKTSLGDFDGYFVPVAAFMHSSLQRGVLPLWNPYQLAGQPFLGLHAPAVLYPPNVLLFGLFQPEAALGLHTILHLSLAGFFTWLFLARLGLEPAACLVGAFVYMLSAPTVICLQFTTYTSTQTWLPALLWAVHGLASEARLRWALGLGLFGALAFLGGHAQAFVWEVQFAAAYGVFALITVTARGRRARVAGLALIAGVFATALAAPQLLPALELARRAIRTLGGLSPAAASFGSVWPLSVELGVLGPAFAREFGRPEASPGWFLVWPLLGLPLVVVGLFARRVRLAWAFFAVSTVLLGLYMTGWWSPVFRLYYHLPFGKLFRAPMRIFFVYFFTIAVLMGIGTHAVTARLRAAGRARAAIVVGGLLLAVSLADLYWRSKLPPSHQTMALVPLPPPPAVVHVLEEEGRTLLDYGSGFAPSNLPVKVGMMQGLFVLPDYEPSMPGNYERYFRIPAKWSPWHGALSVRDLSLWSDAELGRLLDLMSVRRLLSPDPAGDHALFERFASGTARVVDGMLVVDRPSALPHAYTVRCVRREPDVDAALGTVTSPGFDPRAEAVVGTRERTQMPESPASCGAGRDDTAAIVAYDVHRVDIDATCGARCLLVLTDLWYPGWRVSVDGTPAESVPANVLFRGVWLEPGRHRVSYRYVPGSFLAGLALCAATVGMVLVIAVRRRRGPRRLPAVPARPS